MKVTPTGTTHRHHQFMGPEEMRGLFEQLWPICRSITGPGVRQSLDIIERYVDLKRTELPTGTPCFDWEIPREWQIRDAYVATLDGRRVIDFQQNNLHVLGYSVPVDEIVDLPTLMKHIYTLPNQPDAIPYRTSYYKERWGFCLEHRRLTELTEPQYRVVIDSTLEDGHLTLAEAFLPGETNEELLFTSYLCHPSMANNELSGPVALTALYQALAAQPRRKYGVRFLYAPETIGSIAFLSRHHEALKQKVVGGLVLSMVGIDAPLHYKLGRDPQSLTNRIMPELLEITERDRVILPWDPLGGADMRQYSSIGINLPMGFLGRAIGGNYAEYHTSLDTLDIIDLDRMAETVCAVLDLVDTIEENGVHRNLYPWCEPQLGRRGLYPTLSGPLATQQVNTVKALLGYGDGEHDLVTIAHGLGITVMDLVAERDALIRCELLSPNLLEPKTPDARLEQER
ncbi:MAG: DUF4910 domain-containing protein [Bradymonadia bacterium]